MGKRGPKPKGKIDIKWSANFAYAIGLIVSDGNLSINRRHIAFVSKDIEQINNFKKCFNIPDIKIGETFSGAKNKAFRVQFGDVLFYEFLNSIGVTQKKSKTIGELEIPKKYFFDFLRGSFDGDGSFYSYWDPRWKSSHMFYLTFASASKSHIEWIQKCIFKIVKLYGHISKAKNDKAIYSLRYAKREALVIIKKMYYNPKVVCLSRKKIKIQKALKTEIKQQKKYIK